jgi:hypothetical protein
VAPVPGETATAALHRLSSLSTPLDPNHALVRFGGISSKEPVEPCVALVAALEVGPLAPSSFMAFMGATPRMHPETPVILATLLRLILEQTPAVEEALERLVNLRACEAVAVVMSANPGDASVVKPAVLIMNRLITAPPGLPAVASVNGFGLAAAALTAFPRDMDLYAGGCNLLAWAGHPWLREEGGGVPYLPDGCQAVVGALQRSARNRDVQCAGLGAVAGLGSDLGNEAHLRSSGACEAVSAALVTFSRDAEIQELACRAITVFGPGPGDFDTRGWPPIYEHTEQRRLAPACEPIANSLRAYLQDEGFVAAAVEAAGAVAWLSPDNAARLGEAGICEVIAAALCRWPDDLGVQSSGVVAMAILAVFDEQNAERLSSAGCSELLVSMLQGSRDYPAAQGDGLLAACALSRSRGGAERLLAAGGARVVVETLRTSEADIGSEPVVPLWLVALESLAYDAASARCLGDAGACQALGAVFELVSEASLPCRVAILLTGHDPNKQRLLAAGVGDAVRRIRKGQPDLEEAKLLMAALGLREKLWGIF